MNTTVTKTSYENQRYSWYCSNSEISTNIFTWTIDNFSFYLSSKKFPIVSPLFLDCSDAKTEWYLTLDTMPDARHLARITTQVIFNLVPTNTENRTKLPVKIKFSLLGNYGEKVRTRELINECQLELKDLFSWRISRKELMDSPLFYPNDKLTIRCELKICNQPVHSLIDQPYCHFAIPECCIRNDISKLYETRSFSDVTIWIGRNRFKAHKAILAARSTVFAAMFQHKMREKIENKVILKDIEADVFQELLRFIYTGKVVLNEKSCLSLLIAADKYGLERLKNICEKSIAAKITTENAAEVLFFADFHNARQLKHFAIDYINSNPSKIIATNGWKMLLQQPNSPLLSELFSNLAEQVLPPKRIKLA